MASERNYVLLHERIKRVMTEYAGIYEKVKTSNNWRNPFKDIISHDIPSLIADCADIKDPYTVIGSYGKGRWTAVPWIAVFDRRITKTAQKGVYIVYLFNKDAKELYLTLNQGATDIIQSNGADNKTKPTFTGVTGTSSSKKLDELKQRANAIRAQLKNNNFAFGDGINTGAPNYDAGAVFYKKYTVDTLPQGEELANDLIRMLDIYSQYQKIIETKIMNDNSPWWPTPKEYHPGITKEQWIEFLHDPNVIGPVWGGALAMFYDQGGAATCSQLGEIYNRNASGISGNCTQLAMAIHKKTNCPLIKDGEKEKYWPILFVGKKASSDEKGSWVWKLRDELYDAISESDIMKYLSRGNELEMQITIKEAIAQIKSYIASKGFSYNSGIIENFYLSLKSKPFVILAGTSGTGKTRLVKLFAEAIDAEYKMVAVRPDWSDSSDLFGHVDLNGSFIPGAILEFITNASKHPNKPYILCLDEMNLARVEYYLSDFLSVIETRDFDGEKIVSDPLLSSEKYGADNVARTKYGEIGFPQNLYLVGTVNMDETTFPFSKKVLDRANTIEFNYVDLVPEEIEIIDSEKQYLPNEFLKTKYLLLAQCRDEKEYIKDISEKLQKLNTILQKANAHVGYRVRDEIAFYMLNNKETELLSEDEAFDNEIMQKILPRIQGSSSSVKEMLCDLFKEFAGDYEGIQTQSDDTASMMLKKINKDGARYLKSAEKTAFMVRRFEEDGFTSYWL